MHTVIAEHPMLCLFGSNNTQRKSHKCCVPFTDLQRITASLRLSEAERNERGETQFLCRKWRFSRFSVQRFGSRSKHVYHIRFRAILHLFSWVLSRHATALPTHPICIGLLFVFYTRENNCMHPIYFLFKLLSVGFQHCLTIAYSKLYSGIVW